MTMGKTVKKCPSCSAPVRIFDTKVVEGVASVTYICRNGHTHVLTQKGKRTDG